MKVSHYIAAVISAGILLAGCSGGKPPSPGSPPLAEVNGETITVDQLNHRMTFLNLGFTNQSAGGPAGDAKIEALSQLIEETMYLQEAKRLKIQVFPKEVDKYLAHLFSEYPDGVLDGALSRSGLTRQEFRAEAERKLTFEKLIETEVYSKLTADEARLKRYFEEHKKEFHRAMQVRARQIVVDSEASARSILEKLKAGADFAALAKKLSLSPDGENGGDLGYFSKGEMPPEFDEVVFRMKPGELSGVVHTPYGFHIFLVEDVKKAVDPDFEEVKGLVKQRLLSEMGEEAYLKWQAGLRERTSIEIHTEALGRL